MITIVTGCYIGEEKVYMAYTSRSQSIIKGTQDRNSSRNHRRILLADWLTGSYLAVFLCTVGGWHTQGYCGLTKIWASHTSGLSRHTVTKMSGNSSIESPSSQMSLCYIKLTIKTKQDKCPQKFLYIGLLDSIKPMWYSAITIRKLFLKRKS